ncbi:MAG: glycoside hydrolase family 127 protein [Lachnospiraceae bacterium]|nr:glycoside hydrolase family 127 protein [Lachnospiraceae bacterium]
MEFKNLSAFPLSAVAVTDAYLLNAYDKEVAYLTSFNTDKLLAGFRETAGLDLQGVTRYPGWETSLIGGHTLGHYITACVHAYESANATADDRECLLGILERLTFGLQECQEALGTGFLFGATIMDKAKVEQQFDHVENNRTNITTEAWVPWYTMHKIFEGLVSLGNMTTTVEADTTQVAAIAAAAKETASRLADWVYGRMSSWSEAVRNTVLGIEYGGMNDCLYDVYLLTGKAEHLEAAHAFDQTALFDRVFQAEPGDNALNNLHANTTIPKFMGALKRFVVCGEAQYLAYAERFWTMVTENHSYITGGNSEWEHFGLDNVLDGERTNCNCETCNSYNMLKMTKLLFRITGDVKYADWYENTYINSILSSQNPASGMSTYFQPMASGYFKVYGEPFTKFWCCTGSGMENFTKLGESFYFYKDNMLVVNQYLSSELSYGLFGVKLEAAMPESEQVTLTLTRALKGTLALRLPEWLAAEAVITVNGRKQQYDIMGAEKKSGRTGNGYAVLSGDFPEGTVIGLTLPMNVRAYALPDGENTYAFKYGPVVLSALLGTEEMVKSVTGVDVTIPKERVLSREYLDSESESLTVQTATVAEFMEHINDHMVRDNSSDTLKFSLKDTDARLSYVTHYRQHKERYGIYFTFTDAQSTGKTGDERKRWMETCRLDTVQPGYGQYENDELHQMTEAGEGSVGTTENGTSRYAKQNGSFSYTMLVDVAGTDLLAMFDSKDNGKTIRITAGTELVYESVLDSNGREGYYEVVIPVPQNILELAEKKQVYGEEKEVVTFSFAGTGQAESAALCEFLYTMKR